MYGSNKTIEKEAELVITVHYHHFTSFNFFFKYRVIALI